MNYRKKMFRKLTGIKLLVFSVLMKCFFISCDSIFAEYVPIFWVNNQDNELATIVEGLNYNNTITETSHTSHDRYLSISYNRLKDAIGAIHNQGVIPGMKIILTEGYYELADNTIYRIPVEMIIQPGVTMAIGSNSSIVFDNRVDASGTVDKPIIFTWLEEGLPWANIVILNKKSNGSIFHRCTIENASNSYINGTAYPGAISTDEVEVMISDCTFRNIFGEDGINVVKAYSVINHCTFINCPDAIDYMMVAKRV